MDETFHPIALGADDQFFLSQLLLGGDADATPEQATRLFLEGLIERCGKRWILSTAGRELLLGRAGDYPGEVASQYGAVRHDQYRYFKGDDYRHRPPGTS